MELYKYSSYTKTCDIQPLLSYNAGVEMSQNTVYQGQWQSWMTSMTVKQSGVCITDNRPWYSFSIYLVTIYDEYPTGFVYEYGQGTIFKDGDMYLAVAGLSGGNNWSDTRHLTTQAGITIYENTSREDFLAAIAQPLITAITSNGGGATHIAKVTGQLKDLSSNLSDILIVSGGGGGGLISADNNMETVYHSEGNVNNYSFECPYDGCYIFQCLVACDNRTPTITVTSTGTQLVESNSGATVWRGWKEVVFRCSRGDTITFTSDSYGKCKMTNILYVPYNNLQLIETNYDTDITMNVNYTLASANVICTQSVIGIVTCTLTTPQVTGGTAKNVTGEGYRSKWSVSDISPNGASFTANTQSYDNGSNMYCIYQASNPITGAIYPGKEAGGISGSGDNSADQSTGNAFGQGESGTGVSGGGSGLYGGYKGTSAKSGGAGSGYIGNTLVSSKKMVGYNVPTSSAEATKTESVNEASENPVANKPKIGNGFARIKFLRNADPHPEPGYEDILNKFQNCIIWESWDFINHDVMSYSGPPTYERLSPICIINDSEMLQISSWATNGDSYFCGKAKCEITGADGVGYSIVISGMTDTKPIRNGSTEYNHATQIIYNNGYTATSLYNPNLVTLPNNITKTVSYSGVTLRNALEKMISVVVGNCDLIVNGTPWIIV